MTKIASKDTGATLTLEEEYRATRKKSALLHERARKVMPSGIEHDARQMKPFPCYVERAEGGRKWDVDGNELLDCRSAHAAFILGHNPPEVVAAVTEQLKRGFHFSACNENQLQVAELLTKMVPCAEELRFMTTGTEANMLAIRLARAYTGKKKVIKFKGHFHGYWNEGVAGGNPPYNVPMSIGVPKEILDNILLADHNNVEQVRRLIEEDGNVACVILDPSGLMFMFPFKPQRIKEIRQVTAEKGVVLIFDEVASTFRYGPHGLQGVTGVTPDLATMAKAMGGGLPSSAVMGKREIMELIAFTDDAKRNREQRVISQGTHNGNPVVTAAGLAYLKLVANGKPQAYITKLGTILRKKLNEVIKKHAVAGCVHGYFSMAHIDISHGCPNLGKCNTEDCDCPDVAILQKGTPANIRSKLHLAMLINGVDCMGGHFYLNAGLSEQDMDKIADAFDRSLSRLKMEKVL